jgi:hypothetical protein
MLSLLAIYLISMISGRVNGHTWVEQLAVMDLNGQPTGEPGFIRGYGKHTGDEWQQRSNH